MTPCSRSRNSKRSLNLPDLMTRLFSLLAISGLWLATASAVVADTIRDDLFAQANAYYEKQQYDKAHEIYQDLAEEQLSSDVFFNLANASFRLGNVGEACLWYRRAQYMNPGMLEAGQNLRLLRSKLGYMDFEPTGIDKMVARISHSGWTLLMTSGTWILILGLASLLIFKVAQPWYSVVLVATICGGIVGVLSLAGVILHQVNLDPAKLAIVIDNDVAALAAPVPDGKPIIGIPAGSEVRIRKDRQNWLEIETPGDSVGWIKKDQIEPLWPYSARP